MKRTHEGRTTTLRGSGEVGRVTKDGGGRGREALSTVRSVIVLLTSLLVVLLALRNHIKDHLQHLWRASDSFWQLQWDKIMVLHGNDHYNLFVYGGTLSAYIMYWVAGGIYAFMDVTGMPAFIRPYKVQPGTNAPVSIPKLIKCILVVQFNQLVVGITFSKFSYYLATIRGYDQSPQLPTFHRVLFELTVFMFVEEIGFYYSHRLFHHRAIYKYIHKIHHEWNSPISISAWYAHPLEHIFSNIVPVVAGSLILGSHPAIFLLWNPLIVLSTITNHSGYHLPFCKSPEFHDFHHAKSNQCYGVLGLLDHLHGTDDKFRSSRSYTRHTTMLSFVPPRQMFPDHSEDKNVKGM